MKILLLPVAGLLLLTGCGPSEEEREIKQQLAEIKVLLAQLSQSPPIAVGEGKKTADDKVVELPELLKYPTAQEVQEYAGNLQKIKRGSSYERIDHNAYCAAIAAIPPGYIIELAPYLDDYDFYKKIPDWLVNEDKERILKKLPEEPNLLRCLPYMPYRYEDLREPLLALLQNKKSDSLNHIPQVYIDMLIRDPKCRGQVKQLLLKNSDLYFLAYAFAERDGNQGINDQLWKSYILTNQRIPPRMLYERLIAGKVDAVKVLAKEMAENKDPHCPIHNFTVLFPDLKGDLKDPACWLTEHQNQLVFNAKDKKYYLSK